MHFTNNPIIFLIQLLMKVNIIIILINYGGIQIYNFKSELAKIIQEFYNNFTVRKIFYKLLISETVRKKRNCLEEINGFITFSPKKNMEKNITGL